MMNQEETRKQFEVWADENQYALDRSDINKEIYRNNLTRNALLGYLAGYQAALAIKQEAVQFLYDMTPPPEFLEYVRKNYTGEVHFHDSDWHAMRLWNAAMKNFKPPYINFPFKNNVQQEHIESNQELVQRLRDACEGEIEGVVVDI